MTGHSQPGRAWITASTKETRVPLSDRSHRLLSVVLICGLLLSLMSGCALDQTGSDTSLYKAGQREEVQFGRLVEVEPVEVDNRTSRVRSWLWLGGPLGALAGYQLDKQTGKHIFMFSFGLSGYLLGALVGQKIHTTTAHKLTVMTDEGGYVSVTQPANTLTVGQRVMVLSRYTRHRVVPAPDGAESKN